MVVIVWYLDLLLPMQLVSITTNFVSSNPTHGEVYSIQHFVIMFVSDLLKVWSFLWFPPPIKHHISNPVPNSHVNFTKNKDYYYGVRGCGVYDIAEKLQNLR